MGRKPTEQEIVECFGEALRSGYIYAMYQPQINHSTGRMVGAEALMRWHCPKHGLQYPTDFVPVLEDHDLIYQAEGNESLVKRMESLNGVHTVEHAEEIGLGSRSYNLVTIDD